MTTEKIEQLHKELSIGDDIYHYVNKIRSSQSTEEKLDNLAKFFNKGKLLITPQIYLDDVFRDAITLDLPLVKIGKQVSDDVLEYYCTKIIDKNNFENIKKQLQLIELNKQDFQLNRAFFVVAKCFLNNGIHLGLIDEVINNELKYLFMKFIDSGYNYILNLYQENKLRMVYKTLGIKEHKFIICAYLSKKLIEVNNTKGALNYIKEAISIYPNFRHLVEETQLKDITMNIN